MIETKSIHRSEQQEVLLDVSTMPFDEYYAFRVVFHSVFIIRTTSTQTVVVIIPIHDFKAFFKFFDLPLNLQ